MKSETVLIATHSFGACGDEPLTRLKASGLELRFNPYGRRLKAGDVNELLQGVSAVLAGTEPYNAGTLGNADKLRAICRIGIGLDNVDFEACRARGVRVTYTPDAPSQAVAELAVANILNLLRHIHASDHSVRAGAWNRYMGRLVGETVIGVIGVGRIGRRVINLLEPFQPHILANDIDPNVHGTALPNVSWRPADDVFREADLVTVHIPLNRQNHQFVDRRRISLMKTGACLINTSRGGIVDEEALTDAVLQKHLGGAALDVFAREPYEGRLTGSENVVLTAHIGASARASRFLMEKYAAEDCLRLLAGEEPKYPVPED